MGNLYDPDDTQFRNESPFDASGFAGNAFDAERV